MEVGSIEVMDGGNARWTFRNDTGEVVVVHIEPEGDQLAVRPTSILLIEVKGGQRPRDGSPPLEVSAREDGAIIVWSHWPGSLARVVLDNHEI